MTNAVKNLLNPDVIVVFDCDGCLCIYEMSDTKHMVVSNDEWPEYVKTARPYDTAMPVPQVQKFIKDKGLDNVYVCSKAFSDEEEDQKREFIRREYSVLPNNICFVREADDKIKFMREIAEKRCGGDESKVALVEDTVTTIDAIYESSDFLTIHISSFFTYPMLETPDMDELKKGLRQQIGQYQRRADEMKRNAPTARCCEHERLASKARSYEHALAMVEGSNY